MTTYHVSKLINDNSLVINDGYRAKNSQLNNSKGLPFARAGNINGGFNFIDADRVNPEEEHKAGIKVSKAGDVVFTSKGTVGRFAFVQNDTPQFIYSPQLCFWRATNYKLINPRFLYYWMHGPQFLSQIYALKGQTDMADYVSLRDQRAMKLSLPELSTQKAIAHVLGTLDDRIELNRQMNETLEAMAQALFKSWFVDFDPVIDNALAGGKEIPAELSQKAQARAALGDKRRPLPEAIRTLFPDEFAYSDELGWIPKGWEIGTLGEIANFKNGKKPPDRTSGTIPIFGSNGQIGSCLEHNRDDVIIIGRVGSYCGSLFYCNSKCWVTDNTMSAEMNKKENNVFLLELLRIENLNDKRIGSGQPLLNQSILRSIKISKTPNDLISKFTSHSIVLYKKIFLNNKAILNLSKLRDTLLPKLLSGELRIPDAEKMVEELAL